MTCSEVRRLLAALILIPFAPQPRRSKTMLVRKTGGKTRGTALSDDL
jgi:hypothetical protein